MNVDWSVLRWIQEHLRCAPLDFFMPLISALGNAGAIWIAAALLLLCTKRYRRQGLLLAVGLCVGALCGNLLLKPLVARARPCWIDSSYPMLIAIPTDYSFPSGHTLSSVIAATLLYRTDRRFGWPAIALAALIAFSRLYLYVHFPTDVLAAALMGIVIGLLSWQIGCALLDRRDARRASLTHS